MSAFARSYSQAFLEAAPAGYDVDRFLAAADAIRRAILGQPKLKAFFATPAVPVEARRKVLEDLALKVGLDDFGRRFFRLLLDQRRLLFLGPILSALRETADQRSGVVLARVRVAAPLAEAEQHAISRALSQRVGRRVRLATEVDQKIMGGFVARVGSEVFDASVRHAIEQFQQEVTRGAGVRHGD